MMAYRVLQRRLACARFGHPCLPPKTVVQFQFSNGLLFSVMDQLEKATVPNVLLPTISSARLALVCRCGIYEESCYTYYSTSYDLQGSFGPGFPVWYIRIPKHGCGYNHVEYSSLL
jgi:hypothetical protein